VLTDGGERLVPLRKAPGLIPGCPCWQRLRKWARDGLCNGRVRLRLERVGGRLYVSRERLAEFQRAVDRVKDAPRQAPQTGRERRREEARYRAANEAAGWRG
jgi:hypothetical protein